jgi:hypothetical protein
MAFSTVATARKWLKPGAVCWRAGVERADQRVPPTQLLADLLTMQEHLPGKAFNEMTLVYAGDAQQHGQPC